MRKLLSTFAVIMVTGAVSSDSVEGQVASTQAEAGWCEICIPGPIYWPTCGLTNGIGAILCDARITGCYYTGVCYGSDPIAFHQIAPDGSLRYADNPGLVTDVSERGLVRKVVCDKVIVARVYTAEQASRVREEASILSTYSVPGVQ